MATEVGKGFVEIVADFKEFGASVSKGMSGQQAAFTKAGTDAGKSFHTGVGKELSGSQSGFAKFGAQQGTALKTAFSGAVAGVGVAAAVGVGVAIKSAIDAGSALTEQMSKNDAVFGASADVIVAWADTAATSFGMSKTQAIEAATSFGNMFLQLGFGADQALSMSTAVTELATDFASFFNSSPAEALDAISAAFRGEFDAVQRFVPTINAAAVEQKALEMGLAATTKELDGQDKALAAYQLIMEGAGQATGDFDRTQDSLANQQRILQASVGDLSAELGQKLAPVFGEIITVALGVVNVINDASAAVTSLNEAAGQDKGGGGLLKQLTGIDIKWGKDLADVNWDGSKKGADETAESVRALALAVQDGKDGIAGINDVAAQGVGVMSHFGATADSVAQQLDRNVEGMLNLGASADAVAQNVGNETAALLALNDALAANVNATLASFDSTFALAESQRAFNDAAITANSTTGDQTVAFEDAAQAALRVADATVTYAEDQATLNGETLSAKDSQQILIDTLSKLATQIGGPVATQLLNMVGQLQDVGAQHPEPTVSVDDQATQPIANIKGKVDGLDAARASITVNETGNAIDRLGRIESAISRINGMRLGISTSIPGFASGIANFAGGLAMVGEEGPELVHLPPGTAVDSAAKTRASISAVTHLGGGLGPRQPIVIVNQGTFLGTEEAFGKLADRAIAQARRAGNRAA